MGRRRSGSRSGFPHEKSASESIRVITQPAPRRQVVEYLGVAATENDIVGLESRNESINHIKDVLPPPFFSQSVEASRTNIVLISGLLVRQMTKLHRLHNSI